MVTTLLSLPEIAIANLNAIIVLVAMGARGRDFSLLRMGICVEQAHVVVILFICSLLLLLLLWLLWLWWWLMLLPLYCHLIQRTFHV